MYLKYHSCFDWNVVILVFICLNRYRVPYFGKVCNRTKESVTNQRYTLSSIMMKINSSLCKTSRRPTYTSLMLEWCFLCQNNNDENKHYNLRIWRLYAGMAVPSGEWQIREKLTFLQRRASVLLVVHVSTEAPNKQCYIFICTYLRKWKTWAKKWKFPARVDSWNVFTHRNCLGHGLDTYL